MPKQELYLILHNIRSAYNVGSIFRTADGAGVSKIYLCGITPQPSTLNHQLSTKINKISKTALGAEKTVPWEYQKQTWRVLEKLSAQGGSAFGGKKIQIVALEQCSDSIDYRKFKPKFPLALIVGHERKGLNKRILSFSDKIIEIPMCGKKESLNVAVATGIAVYKIVEKNNQ